MKKIIWVLFLTAGLLKTAGAQPINPEILPETVKLVIGQRFITATDWLWNRKGDSTYTAVFKFDGAAHYAEVSIDGKLRLLKYEIRETDLPFQLIEALKTEYPQHQIQEVDKGESGENILYEIELEGYPDYEIIFDPLGNTLDRNVD